MIQFLYRFAFFINFSTFRPDTENNVNFDLYPANAAAAIQ